MDPHSLMGCHPSNPERIALLSTLIAGVSIVGVSRVGTSIVGMSTIFCHREKQIIVIWHTVLSTMYFKMPQNPEKLWKT